MMALAAILTVIAGAVVAWNLGLFSSEPTANAPGEASPAAPQGGEKPRTPIEQVAPGSRGLEGP